MKHLVNVNIMASNGSEHALLEIGGEIVASPNKAGMEGRFLMSSFLGSTKMAASSAYRDVRIIVPLPLILWRSPCWVANSRVFLEWVYGKDKKEWRQMIQPQFESILS
jgi:hypothetical protein